MSTETERNDNNVYASSNQGYDSAGSLQIRLNTEPILQRVEMILRGFREKIDIENGQPIIKYEKDGEALANDLGVQYIIGQLQLILNPQVVQGNFTDEMYGEYLCRHRKNIAKALMTNLNYYQIKEQNYQAIMGMMFSNIEAFISRTINNKERDSYASTIRSIESTQSSTKTGGMLNFFKN